MLRSFLVGALLLIVGAVSIQHGSDLPRFKQASAQIVQFSGASVSSPSLPNVLLDDDEGDDIDNLADIRLFTTLGTNGLINPIAFIADDQDTYGAPAFEAARNFQSASYPIYANQCCSAQTYTYTEAITNTFNPGKTRSNYTDCIEGYRTALNSSSGNVAIVMGGGSYCIDNLLESSANYNGDGLPSGLNIIKAKVAYVIWAAGAWSTPCTSGSPCSGDFNMNSYGTQTADLIANWPSTIPFIFYGVDLAIGSSGPFPSGVCQTSATDPYQYGFYEYSSSANPCTRLWYSQPGLIYAEQGGVGSLFSVAASNGTVSFNGVTGSYYFSATAGPFSYLANAASGSTITSTICTNERIAGTNWC